MLKYSGKKGEDNTERWDNKMRFGKLNRFTEFTEFEFFFSSFLPLPPW